MRLVLTTFLISMIAAFGGETNSAPSKPIIGNSPNSFHIDYKNGIPIFATGFPPYTEIKDPYTGHIWIVQPDGTLKKKTAEATK